MQDYTKWAYLRLLRRCGAALLLPVVALLAPVTYLGNALGCLFYRLRGWS